MAQSYRNVRPGMLGEHGEWAWPLSFWVVGQLLQPDDASCDAKEFFVAYQDGIAQDVSELAHRFTFGC